MKIKTLTLLVLAAVMSLACGSKDNPITPSISLSGNRTLSVPAEGAKETVSFTSSLSWVASADVSWIHLSKTSGTGGSATVEVTIDQNYEKERSGNVTFTVSGSSVSATVAIAQAGVENIDPDDPPVVQGDPVLSVDFTTLKSLGEFTVQDKDKGDFSGSIWGTNADHPEYGAVAKAYDGKNHKTESWLVSPRINLKGHDQLYLRFDHALNYMYSETDIAKFIGVKISADKGETWESVTVPNLTSGSSFEFQSSGDIDLKKYKDQVIQFAFTYKTTEATAPTWEIQKILITKEKEVIVKTDYGDEYKSVPAWMELPEVKEGDKYYIHTAPIGQVNYRNYSFIYDADALVANWVAYPLCDLYTKKTVQRTDAWAADPFVSTQAIYAKAGDIYNDGKGGAKYNRGHQLPSADRLASTKMNEQTFYYTNIAPQLSDKAFNAGIWEDLETAVRNWSSSSNSTDTLYVVTGCMVDNPIEYRKDNEGKQVPIPNAFFKALLRLSKGSYIGAGFYFDHKSYQGQPVTIKDFAMSIKDLEEKTGFNFFVNLPADKSAAIKAEDPTGNSFWNLK